MSYEPKLLKYKELPGISAKQLEEHHGVLYAGYCKKIGEIEEKLKTAAKADANASYSEIRELKLEETFVRNAISLHEGYFKNLTSNSIKPEGEVLKLIEDNFGSYEAWEEEFKALGISARGWVVLAWDANLGRAVNYLCDVHNQGGIWNAVPLLILDVYEHAYFVDYGTKRAAYIDAFMNNVDWSVVSDRIRNKEARSKG